MYKARSFFFVLYGPFDHGLERERDNINIQRTKRFVPTGSDCSLLSVCANIGKMKKKMKKIRFGAGLPPPEDPSIDYSRVINYDKQQGDSQWAGITSTEFVAPGSCSEKVQAMSDV